MVRSKKSLEQELKKLQDEDESVNLKRWNEEIFSKLILLFPSLIFLVTFLVINNGKDIADLFIFIGTSIILVIFGVSLNFFLTKK